MNTSKKHASKNLMSGLVRAVFWVDESLQNELEHQGWPRLSRRKSLIMAYIADGVGRPSRLAQKLDVSRQAVHQTLKEMESGGLITMRPDPADSRAIIVEFSEVTRNIRDSALSASDFILDVLANRVGEDAVSQIMDVLHQDWGPVIDRRK